MDPGPSVAPCIDCSTPLHAASSAKAGMAEGRCFDAATGSMAAKAEVQMGRECFLNGTDNMLPLILSKIDL